jgi:hypothetical protein
MIKRHLRPVHPFTPLLALMLGTLPLASLAQSAYTLTVLRSPNGNAPVPYDMDNTGKVVGLYQVLGINTADGSPKLQYRNTGVSWSASTASSLTGSKAASSYVPLKVNATGTTAGFKTSAASFTFSGDPILEKAGKLTTLTYTNPSDAPGPVMLGSINSAGVVVGTGFNNGHSAVLMKPGQIRDLERLPNHLSTFGNSVNDQEQVAGAVYLSNSDLPPGVFHDIRAAVWTNGKLSWVAEQQTEARVINNAGQVLVAKAFGPQIGNSAGAISLGVRDARTTIKGSASVRLGSSIQTIGRDDQVVNPTDMNNAGTVVGCIDNVPFIWKNGVVLDLVKEVNSKGAKLPTNVVIECPVAINDSGSILISHRPSEFDFKRTWVRINAKP